MYSHVFVGGTFDRFHKGHGVVIQQAIEQGQKVTIGITSRKFLEKYKKEYVGSIQDQTVRMEQLRSWVRNLYPNAVVDYIFIDDPYEPVVSSIDIDALIVTAQNIQTGENINKKRLEQSLGELSLICIDIVEAEDHSAISSTRIREGSIDREGKLLLPDFLREDLRKPFGRVLSVEGDIAESMKKASQTGILTIGDRTTMTARKMGIVPILSVIDFQVERQSYESLDAFMYPDHVHYKRFTSGPGYISKDVVEFIKMWWENLYTQHTVILIDGEDDLVTLPILAYGKETYTIYYGQPGEGVVEVHVTQTIREQARMLLESFVRG